MSIPTNYTFKSGTVPVDIGTVFCDLSNNQTVNGNKTMNYIKVNKGETIELGGNVATKDINSGKIGYEAFTTGSVDIVGAGPATPVNSRNVKIWDNLTVSNNLVVNGAVNVGSMTSTVFKGTRPSYYDGTNSFNLAFTSEIPSTAGFVTTTDYPFSGVTYEPRGWNQNSQKVFALPGSDWGLYLVIVRSYDNAGIITSDLNGMLIFFFTKCYDRHGQGTTNTLLKGNNGNCFESYGNGDVASDGNTDGFNVRINNTTGYTYGARVRIVKWI